MKPLLIANRCTAWGNKATTLHIERNMSRTTNSEPDCCINTSVRIVCVCVCVFVCTNHPRRAGPAHRGGRNTSQSKGHTSLHSDNRTGCYRPAQRSPADRLEEEKGESIGT
ncbi:uncharacterized protein ACO6RY_00960 [Pungitius sinensis]